MLWGLGDRLSTGEGLQAIQDDSILARGIVLVVYSNAKIGTS